MRKDVDSPYVLQHKCTNEVDSGKILRMSRVSSCPHWV